VTRSPINQLCAAVLLIGLLFAVAPGAQTPRSNVQVVIVVDGLRPDAVTPEQMPRLAALGRRGIVFNAHHSVFPTVTRVNASSMATGVYPETHGLLGNTIYIPAVNAARGLDTGSRETLESVARATGRLLTAPTLGELMAKAGKKLMTIGSGSTGALFLLDSTSTGVAAHHDFARPPDFGSRLAAKLGPPPAHATPNAALHRRAIDTYLTLGLDEVRPNLTFLWISDPDTTAHAKGLGAAATRDALRLVDAEIGRLEDTLRGRGLLDRTNLIIVSDHGFSTHSRELKLAALVEPFAKKLPDGSSDIVIAEGAIYFRGGTDPSRTAAIVAALQKRPEVGAIFTRPSGRGVEGTVAGTLSFDVARWNHPRAGEILVAANWSDAANEAGARGTSTDGGVAGHGTSSPFDVHATLVAAGPDFREHATSDVPTGNVDLAPTLLELLGIPVPRTMTGRSIDEGLRRGPAPASLRVERSTAAVKNADGSYRVVAHISTVGGRQYLDFTEVSRSRP
jgi:arylsulfatase A-like enzyme